MDEPVLSLCALRAATVRTTFATRSAPLPAPDVPITWIVAANGTFKRGVGPVLDVLLQVAQHPSPIPDLVPLRPRVIFRGVGSRLPLRLLWEAWRAAVAAQITVGDHIVLAEQQQHVVLWQGRPILVIPPQTATETSIRYCLPHAPMLLDLHSHGAARPFWSGTDDRDDQGLSVSAVIGSLASTPTIVVRLNVHGHHQIVPASLIFDGPIPFGDGGVDVSAPL